jgi:2-keto-4-pentenoate hydratase/2-oxohepta-3-ene-1,7-dioic acid hydratase in catechol pathway
MRLCRVQTEVLAPFFALELKHKLLRVREAAREFGLAEADLGILETPHAYFQNLPKSESALRSLLKLISENPKKLAKPASDGQPFLLNAASATYLPPIERPAKILCIGLNYRDHCEEQNKPIPKKPVVFTKFATSLIGHGAEIPLPLKLDKCIDYEAELAIVIGKQATRVTKRTAMKHVGGYTIVNDVSARTVQSTERQWTRAKGFDGSCPCGPVIVTPDEVPDPHALDISLTLNGKVMQKSNTSNLVFTVPDLIAFISQAITLEPGDIISTGTCGGVGVYRDPQVFMQEGDVVEVKVERIGVLRNRCGA